jgi:hypothetical protein
MNKVGDSGHLSLKERRAWQGGYDAKRNAAEYGSGQESHFVENDLVNTSSPRAGADLLKINVPNELARRLIYFHIETQTSVQSANHYVRGYLTLKRSGREVGQLPASVARDIPDTDGTGELLVDSTARIVGQGPNALSVQLPRAFENDRLTIGPFELDATIDEITYSISSVKARSGTVSGVRVYLACLSLKKNVDQS